MIYPTEGSNEAIYNSRTDSEAECNTKPEIS